MEWNPTQTMPLAIPAERSEILPRVDAAHYLILLIALLTLGSGLLNIYSVIGPSLTERVELLRRFLPLEVVHYSRSIVLFTGIALVASSLNILRRKRRAWLLAMALTVTAVVLHMAKGIDYEEASFSVILGIALWLVRGQFTVRSREVDLRSASLRASVVASLAMGYGVAGFWLLEPREFGINFNWKQSLLHTINILMFSDTSGLVAHTRYAAWFLESLHLITFGTLFYVIWSLFRPVLYRFSHAPGGCR